jgi:hypothetical protein
MEKRGKSTRPETLILLKSDPRVTGMPPLSFWQTFVLYSKWSVEMFWAGGPWYIAPVLTINLLAAAAFSRWFSRGNWQPRFRWVLSQVLFFPAFILAGVFGQYVHPRYDAGTQSFWVAVAYVTVLGMLLAALLFGTYWVVKLKGHRWFAISLLLFNLWLLWNAGFIAGMAIAADWI